MSKELRLFSLGLTLRRPGKHSKILCGCTCGETKWTNSYNFMRGLAASCGCLRSEFGSSKKTHGSPREYRVWAGAKHRCSAPGHKSYKNYGGRGIYMVEEWVNSPEQFLVDMGPCPEGCTLERKDNDGPYAPWNCVWASRSDQARNKRHPKGEAAPRARLTETQVLEIRKRFDEGASKAALGRDYGVTDAAIYRIVNRLSWKHI